LINLKRKEN